MRKFEIASDLDIFDSMILPPDFLETVVSAEHVVRVAHEHAQRIIQDAEVERHNIIAESRNEAETRLIELKEAMRAEFESAKGQVITEMYAQMEEFLTKFRSGIPYLVENILYKIIGEFDAQQLIARCIAMGIEEMRDATQIIIRVNSADEEAVKALLKPWLRDQKAGGGFIHLEGDTFIAEREAVILTEIGSVELSIDKQLSVFVDNLKEKFGTNIKAPGATQGKIAS
ncbi:MAG: flagellar biosynthesis/type III secretory pathway protein FliH [Alphaproteobacteria bacterium]